MKKFNKILVTIYIHPEYYPPTLNAIAGFSEYSDSTIVVTRNQVNSTWEFPANVKLRQSGSLMSLKDSMQQSNFGKIWSFYQYLKLLYQNVKCEKPDLIVANDAFALFAYRLIKPIISHKHLIWYHNHDINEMPKSRNLSIGWLAVLSEPKMFPYLNIFSLPAEERKKYFPMNHFKGDYYFIPNFPSKSFYQKFKQIKKDNSCIKLLFQGSISYNHGIEELMRLLPFKINGKSVKLILKGFLKDPFKTELDKTLQKKSISDYVEIFGTTSYSDVPKITSACHIGLAVFTNQNIMNQTLGTASNKIYEYAACGLPILYYDSEHFKRHLSKYKWAIPTDLTEKSLIKSIEFIDANYIELSEAARSDFENFLNFEYHFKKIIENLKFN